MVLIKVAFKYLKKYPILAALLFFSIVIASLSEGASFGMLIPLIQSMAAGRSVFVSNILIFLLGVIIIKNLFAYLSNLLTSKLRSGISRDLNAALMSKIIDYDLSYIDGVKTGHIISTLNNETRRMGDFVSEMLQFTALLGRVSVFVILLLIISVKVSLAIFSLIAIVLLPLELIMKRLKILSTLLSRSLADYTYKLTEVLNGLRLIKSSATEDIEKRDFKNYADGVYKSQFEASIYANLLIPVSEISIFALIVASLFVLMHLVKIDIPKSFPFIATYLLVLAKTLTQVNTLNSLRSSAVNNLAAFKSYEVMYDEKGKKTISGGSLSIERLRDSIEFKDVSFSYDGSKRVLVKIDAKIPAGKITAIVGASGVGKTTLVNLILRFYDVTAGKILVDGIDLRVLDLKRWRRGIGLVSQDIFIFNASVRENISYGHDVKDEDIIAAAKASGAHDFIIGLSKKYDTVLGERGVKLSGGEKQRISIARAIIHNPQILILDEATSSLDTETERLIRESIEKLTKGRTVIAIAHRLSTILHADKIIVLDGGRIAECGTHQDLIEKSMLYKELYNAQFNA